MLTTNPSNFVVCAKKLKINARKSTFAQNIGHSFTQKNAYIDQYAVRSLM